MAIPTSKRKAALVAYEAGEGSLAEIAERHGVGRASLARWLARQRKGETIDPRWSPGGQPALDDADQAVLLHLAKRSPGASPEELLPELTRITGKTAKPSTLARYLRRMAADTRDVEEATSPPGPGTDLTDHEWELLRPIFEPGAAGRSRWPARRRLEAVLHVVRTGCEWSELPEGYPPRRSVQASLSRWIADGRIERMHGVLRGMWGELA